MIEKELKAAEYDSMRAKDSLQDDDPKWATIQGYYAMFHIARALIFKQGYREKSHRCLVIAIQELYVDKGKLPVEYLDSFRAVPFALLVLPVPLAIWKSYIPLW
ncbi:HEPN domain-containing protein [candidate division WOR-3 bacterium]|nr:HEPN domain-containing protein [candidate division WOR-3 bacterium]